ncbi:hypothetical protein ARNL5_01559, partial [Anaerolineae bacterium]
EVTDNANSAHFATLSVITRSQWIHVALVYQNGTVTLYQNGVQVTQPITSYSPMRASTQPLYLAHRYLTNEAGAFKGSLDEVRLYNRALSSTEIQALTSLPDNPPTPTPTPTPTATPLPTPLAPSNLTATVSSPTGGSLTWSDNSTDETGFAIERMTKSSDWISIDTVGVNVTSYYDTPCGGGWETNGAPSWKGTPGLAVPVRYAPPGSTTFYYRVRAFNGVGYSGYSNNASFTIVCSVVLEDLETNRPAAKALLAPKYASDLISWIWRIVATYIPSAKVALAPLSAMSTPSNGVIWRTYYAGAVREKTATTDNLYYVYGDALNSASLTTNSTGGWVGEQRYKPFGEPRLGFPQGDLHTDRRFTNQRSEEASLGSLYDYNARMYSPYLNRWLSPDTIVPDPKNPQSLNRYSYVRNNPLKYVDPTGHRETC